MKNIEFRTTESGTFVVLQMTFIILQVFSEEANFVNDITYVRGIL